MNVLFVFVVENMRICFLRVIISDLLSFSSHHFSFTFMSFGLICSFFLSVFTRSFPEFASIVMFPLSVNFCNKKSAKESISLVISSDSA